MNNLLLNEGSQASSIVWLVILVAMVILMLVLPTITQKKRIKAYEEMKSRLRAGDKVQTIGGIVGRIVKVKDANGTQTVLIETGDRSNKTVIEFDINAIAGVVEGLNNPTPVETETQPEEVNVDWEPETIEPEQPEVKTETTSTQKKKSSKKK